MEESPESVGPVDLFDPSQDENDILKGILGDIPKNDSRTFKKPAPVKRVTERMTQLPLNRVKSIIKMDPDVSVVSHEAVFLIARATELFISSLSKETYKHTLRAKRKTVQRKDFDAAVESIDQLCFLEGTD